MKYPYKLLDAGKYQKALQAYERLLAKNPNDQEALAGYPYAYLCLGRLDEALEGFLKSNERAKQNPVGEKQPYLMDVGMVQWLLGRRDDALRTFRAGVDGILDGTIEFADSAGGATQGLLLWYAGVSAYDNDARTHAIKYMWELARKKNIENSPGPLAQFAVGILSKDDLLRNTFSTKNIRLITLKAKWDGRAKADLLRICFYFAVQSRAEGDEEQCHAWMLKCSQLNYFPYSMEWHLSKAEVQNAQRKQVPYKKTTPIGDVAHAQCIKKPSEDLLSRGKYTEAYLEYKQLFAKNPSNREALSGYPFACLCLGRLDEALNGFLQANDQEKWKPEIGNHKTYLINAGVIQWLLGRREQAIQTLRAAAQSVLKGNIEYVDAAGGARQGLLLLYVALSASDEATHEFAVKYIRKLAKKACIKYWPGPLAEFAIGRISAAAMFHKVFGTRYVFLIVLISKLNASMAFNLAMIKFYLAMKCRTLDDEEGFQYWMCECSQFKKANPMMEWYLAKAEVQNFPPIASQKSWMRKLFIRWRSLKSINHANLPNEYPPHFGPKKKEPYDLYKEEKYEEAYQAYKRMLENDPDDEIAFEMYAFACLVTGRFEEALDRFHSANRRTGYQPYLIEVGVLQWLLDKRDEAIQTFRNGVDEIFDAGDRTDFEKQALLLWYAGISTPDVEAREHAVEYMNSLITEKSTRYWPGLAPDWPLAAFAVGAITEEVLLRIIFGTQFLWLIEWIAKFRDATARDLATVSFYIGVKYRELGDEEQYRHWTLKCSRFKQGEPMIEWYLAKKEVENFSSST